MGRCPNLSALAQSVSFSGEQMQVQLQDGRSLLIPLAWFPALMRATDAQRRDWRLIGGGLGIHWEALDEDISVPRLLGLPCE
jgi:hypothetical protein